MVRDKVRSCKVSLISTVRPPMKGTVDNVSNVRNVSNVSNVGIVH